MVKLIIGHSDITIYREIFRKWLLKPGIRGWLTAIFLLNASFLYAQKEIPLFTGTSPPVVNSTASLILNDDLINKSTLSWSSEDTILNQIELDNISASLWNYFPGSASSPPRLVFIASSEGVQLNGNILFGEYQRAVVDVVKDSRRIRYLLKPVDIDMIIADISDQEIETAPEANEEDQAGFSGAPGEPGGNGGFGGPPEDTTMMTLADPFKIHDFTLDLSTNPATVTMTVTSNVSDFSQVFVLTETAVGSNFYVDDTGSQNVSILSPPTSNSAIYDSMEIFYISSTFGWFGSTILTETGVSTNIFETEHAIMQVDMATAPDPSIIDSMTVTLNSDLTAKSGIGPIVDTLTETGPNTNEFVGSEMTLTTSFHFPAPGGRLAVTAKVQSDALGYVHKIIDAVQDPSVAPVHLTTSNLFNQGEATLDATNLSSYFWSPVIPDGKKILRNYEEAGLFYQRGSGPILPVQGLDKDVVQLKKVSKAGESDFYEMTRKGDNSNRYEFFVKKDDTYTVPSWRKRGAWPNGICESNHSIILAGVKAGDKLIVRLQRIPTVTADLTIFRIVQNHDLWWFGGDNAANYRERVTLTAEGITTGDFKWEVSVGNDKINFENNSDSFTASNDNTVDLLSTAASAAKAAVTKDITVQLKINNSRPGSYYTAVFAPRRMVFLRNVDSADGTFGYASRMHYRIEDQFNRVLPANIELNEQFTTAQVADFVGMNWRRGSPSGATVAPADWTDLVQGENLGRVNVPVPQNPQSPLGSIAVSHWDGEWYVGSTTVGDGLRTQTNRWQKYRDHARHTNITSPP